MSVLLLERCTEILKKDVAETAVESAELNKLNGDMPVITIRNEHWFACAQILRHHAELQLHYLRNIAGSDLESHMEVIYHLISLERKENYAFKVKTDRNEPIIASVTAIWPAANWNEREIYDLLGIEFPGHPNLTRIMMPDDWIGHPLRKDYEPFDPEV